MVFHPVIVAGWSVLTLDRWWLTRPPLEPGQTGGLGVRIANIGYGYGYGTWCRLSSLDSAVSVLKDSFGLGKVSPHSLVTVADGFVVAVSPSCPVGHAAWMLLHVASDDSEEDDSLQLLVGDYGFADDMESGEEKWSHGGTGDMWHRTSYRTHSGANAWYCGDEATKKYPSGMDAWLTTVPFTVAQGCSLRFWRWFATPNYGVDGIHAIVVRGAVEDTLDFVGTGGALRRRDMTEMSDISDRVPSRLDEGRGRGLSPLSSADRIPGEPVPFVNESGWAEEKYDLSWLGVGETIRVKLVFVSDRDTVDEGFYIDDVRVTGGDAPAASVAGVAAAPGLFPTLDVWPNPFHSRMQIRYGVAGELQRLSVYDAAGRLVRRLPVTRVTTWDGRDSRGRRLPAGAYFIEARGSAERRLAKVLLAR